MSCTVDVDLYPANDAVVVVHVVVVVHHVADRYQ